MNRSLITFRGGAGGGSFNTRQSRALVPYGRFAGGARRNRQGRLVYPKTPEQKAKAAQRAKELNREKTAWLHSHGFGRGPPRTKEEKRQMARNRYYNTPPAVHRERARKARFNRNAKLAATGFYASRGGRVGRTGRQSGLYPHSISRRGTGSMYDID